MGVVSSAFGSACWVVLGVTFAAALLRTRALNLFGAAAFVFVMFWVSRAVSQQLTPPLSMAHYGLQDVVMIGLLLWTWGRRHELWKVVVAFLLLLQLGFHVGYWGLYVLGDQTTSGLRGYILLNNIGMAGILLSLSVQGGVHVVAGLADLHRRGALLHWGHSASRQGPVA